MLWVEIFQHLFFSLVSFIKFHVPRSFLKYFASDPVQNRRVHVAILALNYKLSPEKNLQGLNEILTHDLCISATVLYQLS